MPEWIETELKLGLNGEEAWQRLRTRLGPGRVVSQANHFLDRPEGSFRRARIGIRLRAQNGDRTLTVKGDSAPSETALTRRIELESAVDGAAFDRALREGLDLVPWIEGWRDRVGAEPEIRDFLGRVEGLAADAPLHCFGFFENRRESWPLTLDTRSGPIQLELELDRTEFPGGRVDFELEVELEVELEAEEAKERDGAVGMTETQRALTHWLEAELGIQTFTVDSKLARLSAILDDEGVA